MKALTDEQLMETVRLVEEHGGVMAAARASGIPHRTISGHYSKAVSKNLTHHFAGKLPPGYHMGPTTALVDSDGNVKLEWQRRLPDPEQVQRYMDDLIDLAQQEITPLEEVAEPPLQELGKLTLYPIVDVHLGLYAWKEESGENYDLKIAKQQLMMTSSKLMRLSPNSSDALIVVLGDYYHADNNMAQTEKSHNHLDVDGRHDKVLHVGAELAIWEIDMALQKHGHVTVKVMRGNHDNNSSKALAMTLYFRYQGNPRVTIDRSPMDLWVYEFGTNMLGFTHGDNVKAEDMPGVMAAHYPEMWGRTKYRFGFSGHFHRRKSGPLSDEKHGAEWEILPAFTAKDAWNREMGHASKRSMQSVTFDITAGRETTTYVNL